MLAETMIRVRTILIFRGHCYAIQ